MQGDAKEEVRARLNIEDVIGEYVVLKRAGRNFKGLSPFSGEKTPSFYVSPDKNIWHDFSSNKGGDLFTFVMEAEGMDFRQALEHLARKAGVDLSMYENKSSQDLARRKRRLIEATELAVSYYQHSLVRNRGALDYVVKQRHLSREVAQLFRIGYAPDTGSALTNFLQKRGFSTQELTEAGLCNRYGSDLFRGRMMIPLMDGSGQPIGFTGRIIGDVENAPKYLNTPQTLLYDKGRHVFALAQAKEAIRSRGYVVVVEGNLDVVSSHQAGVNQTVATAGTAMTEHHLKALKRLSADVRLAYDGDSAGLAATERAIAIASQLGIELTIISLPDGAKDPDELIQKDAAAWQRAIDEARPAVDWILDQYSGRVDMKSALGKRTFTSAGLGLVALLHDPVEREHYERIIAKMTSSTLEAVREKMKQNSSEPASLRTVQPASGSEVSEKDFVTQDNALAVAAVDAPSQELFAQMNLEILEGPARQALGRYFARNPGTVIMDTPDELQEFDEYVKIVLLRAEARYADWNDQDRFYETARLIRQIENEYKKHKRDQLTNELRDTEAAHDDERADELRQELNQLIKEIARGR